MKFEVVRNGGEWREPVAPVSVADFTDGFAAIEFARLLSKADGVQDVAIYLRPETTIEAASGAVTISE